MAVEDESASTQTWELPRAHCFTMSWLTMQDMLWKSVYDEENGQASFVWMTLPTGRN
jgi:hypothetical protein